MMTTTVQSQVYVFTVIIDHVVLLFSSVVELLLP